MTPEICLCSVPHSGTRFTEKLFTSHRPKWHVIGLNGKPNRAPTVYEGHILKPTNMRFVRELGRRMPIVVPLRHPYRTEQSWIKRWDRQYRDDLWEAYDNLFAIYDELKAETTFLPIDASPPVRRRQVRVLSRVCGADFNVDWGDIVNSKAETWKLDLAEIEPSERIQGVAKHPLFVAYYGTSNGHRSGRQTVSA